MVLSDPDEQNIFWVEVSSEVPFGPRWPPTFPNVPKKKWENLDRELKKSNNVI